MNKTIVTFLFVISSLVVFGQDEKTFNVYDSQANGEQQIKNAVKEAKASGKHVFIQMGGNWCVWCRIFHKWSHETASVDSIFNADFVVVHLNYSKENRNEALLKKLEYPQRFGFPVFIILDSNGKRLHTQSTGYLEEGKGYSEEKVTEFLLQWNTAALSDKTYEK